MNVNINNKNSNSFLPNLTSKRKKIENKLSLKKNNRNTFNTSLYSIYSNNNNNIKLKSKIDKYNTSNFSDNSNNTNFEQNIFEYKNVIKNFEKNKPIKLNKNLLVLSDDDINKKNYSNKKNSTNLVNILNNGNNDKNVEINFNKYEIKILSEKHNNNNNNKNKSNKNIFNSSNENINSEFNYKSYKKQHSKSNGEIMNLNKKNNYLEISNNMQFYINNSSNIKKKNSFKIISQNYLIGGISSTNESDNNMNINKNKYYIKGNKNKYNNFLKNHSISLNNSKIKDIFNNNNNKKDIKHTKFLSNSNLNIIKYSPILKLDLQSQRTSSNDNEKSGNRKISSSNLSSCDFFDNKNDNNIKNITTISRNKSKREKNTMSSYNSEKIIIKSDFEDNEIKKEIKDNIIFKTPNKKKSDLSKFDYWTKKDNLKKKIKIKLKKKNSYFNNNNHFNNFQNLNNNNILNNKYHSGKIEEFKDIDDDIDIKDDTNNSKESYKIKKKKSSNKIKKEKKKQNIKKLNLMPILPLVKTFPLKIIKKQLTIVDEFKEVENNKNNYYEDDDLSILTSPTNYNRYKSKTKFQITSHPKIDIKRQNTFPFILKDKKHDNYENEHSFLHNSFKNFKSLSIFEKILNYQQSIKNIVNEGYQTNEETSPINSSYIKKKVKKNKSSQSVGINNLHLKKSSVRINSKFYFDKNINKDISESIIEKNKNFLKKILNETNLKNKLDVIELNNQITKDDYINKSVMKFDIIVNKIYESNKINLQKISNMKLNLYFKSNQIKIQNFFKKQIDYSFYKKKKINNFIHSLKFNLPTQFRDYILRKYFKIEIETIMKGTFLNNDFNHPHVDNLNNQKINNEVTIFDNFNLFKTRRKSSVRKSIFRYKAIRLSKTIFLNFVSQKYLNKFYLKEWGIEDIVIKEIKFDLASYTKTNNNMILPSKTFKNIFTKNSINYKNYLRYSSRRNSSNSLLNGLNSFRKRTKYISKKLLTNNVKKNTLLNYLRQEDGLLRDKQFFERIRDDFFNIEFSKIQKDKNIKRKSIIIRKEEKIYSSPFKRFSLTDIYQNVQDTPRNSFNKETMMYETHKIKSNIIKKCDDMNDILFLYIKDRNYQNFANKFIKYKIDKDNRDDEGNTYLNLAIQCDCKEITNFLIKWGADPNIGNNKMNTPLHYALSYQNFELADILINAGADESIKNYDGLTPWQCVNIDHSIM